jgi:hypothetical protein
VLSVSLGNGTMSMVLGGIFYNSGLVEAKGLTLNECNGPVRAVHLPKNDTG